MYKILAAVDEFILRVASGQFLFFEPFLSICFGKLKKGLVNNFIERAMNLDGTKIKGFWSVFLQIFTLFFNYLNFNFYVSLIKKI